MISYVAPPFEHYTPQPLRPFSAKARDSCIANCGFLPFSAAALRQLFRRACRLVMPPKRKAPAKPKHDTLPVNERELRRGRPSNSPAIGRSVVIFVVCVGA